MSQESGVSSKSTEVLLVDDEPQIRKLLTHLLMKDGGYHVLTSSSGEAALALLRDRSEKIDTLITDIDMGCMSGIGLYRHIRVERPETAVLFISANADCIRESLPGCPVLEKPFQPRQFVARVAGVLSTSKSGGSRVSV